jgi:hypothetical protein
MIQSNPVQLAGDTPQSAADAFFEFQRKSEEAYRAYLDSIRHKVPSAVYDFATAEWHYDPNDHKCPHDAWVQEIRVLEMAEGERAEIRATCIEMILLGAYHDRLFKLTYLGVSSYSLAAANAVRGHGDWITDEIRLSDNELVIHEIEFSSGASMLVECKDLLFEEKLTNSPYAAKW